MTDITPDALAELERVEKAATPGPWFSTRDMRTPEDNHFLVFRSFAPSLIARIRELEAENAELARQVYVPGLWRCPKCEFKLLQGNLNAADGTVTARNEPGDKCPNCDGPLWRVSEREAGNSMVDRYQEQIEARKQAEARAEKAEAELACLKAPLDGAETSADDREAMSGASAQEVRAAWLAALLRDLDHATAQARMAGEHEQEDADRIAWMTVAMQETLRVGAAGDMPSEGPLGYPHIAGMSMRTEGFSASKLGRWLGWMQAAVVASRSATLEDMKEINQRCSAAVNSRPNEVEVYRHRKGGLYRVLCRGVLEADHTPVVIYRAIADGTVWVRPSSEFDDGRFTTEAGDACRSTERPCASS